MQEELESPALPEPHENLTCKEACMHAKARCFNIRGFRGFFIYLWEHRSVAIGLSVLFALVFLVTLGQIFYYEPREVVYKQSSVPVLHGYDVVAMFFLGKWSHATRGRSTISASFHNWTDTRDNVTYSYVFWFSSDNNRQLFLRDPWKYVPRFGGFSTYKTAREDFWQPFPDPGSHSGWHAPPAHPDAFYVYKNRLYFDYSLEYKKLLIQETDALIRV